jgi:hypothetical protein
MKRLFYVTSLDIYKEVNCFKKVDITWGANPYNNLHKVSRCFHGSRLYYIMVDVTDLYGSSCFGFSNFVNLSILEFGKSYYSRFKL